jgi:hypothetical protein
VIMEVSEKVVGFVSFPYLVFTFGSLLSLVYALELVYVSFL